MWQRWKPSVRGCNSFPWKSIHTNIFLYSQLAFFCFPLHLVSQPASRILPYSTPAFVINNNPPFNQITPSANIHEHHYLRSKSILMVRSHRYFLQKVLYQFTHHWAATPHSPGVMSSIFHINFKARSLNRCKDFLSYSSHCKMMHRLYLWADISWLS